MDFTHATPILDLPALRQAGYGHLTQDLPDTMNNLSVTALEDPGGGPEAMSTGEAVLFATATSACICATIIGNILVILSVFTYKPLKCVANFFIVSLAVSDLAVATLVMPFNVANFIIGRWVFGVLFCNMWLTFDILTCTASILNLCAIAIDRYYAIHDPLMYASKRTLKRVLIIIGLVWGLSAIISIPPLIGWNNSSGSGLYDVTTGICTLTDEKGYVIYSSAGSFYIPLMIMSFVYFNIFRATRRRLRQRANAAAAAKVAAATGKGLHGKDNPAVDHIAPETSSTETPEEAHNASTHSNLGNQGKGATNYSQQTDKCNEHPQKTTTDSTAPLTAANDSHKEKSAVHQFLEEKQRISLSRERRAARTMAIIMGVFVLCWLPFFLMYVIFPFCDSCAHADPRIINFIVWLGYVNSSLNPVIYTIFNIDFRRAFKRLLQGKWKS